MELTLEEMSAELDRLTSDSPLTDEVELGLQEEISKHETTIAAIDSVKEQIAEEGASRETAMALESYCPGILPERYPVRSFTAIPSATNQRIALESASVGKIAAIAAIVTAVFVALYKLIRWVIQLLRGTKSMGESAMKEAAQAQTAAATVNEVVKETNGPVVVKNFDPNEISALREKVFITPARQQMSKAWFMLFLEQRPLSRKLYAEVCQLLKDGIVRDIDMGVQLTIKKINDFLLASRKNETTQNHDWIDQIEQPLRPFVYGLEKAGVLKVENDFHGDRYNRVGKTLLPIKQDQYLWAVTLHGGSLTQPVDLKVEDDKEATALFASNQLMKPDALSSDAVVKKFADAAKWFGESIQLPDAIEDQISGVENSIGDLQKSIALFEREGQRDANAAILAPGLVAHLRSLQNDLQFVCRMVRAVRALQRETAVFFRLMTAGETACLNYIASLTEDPNNAEIKDIVAKQRKLHKDRLSEFKGYAG